MKILFLTDFSENSKNAMLYGLSLFKEITSTIIVLNVQKARNFTTADFLTAPPGASVYESLMADNAKELDEFMQPIIAANNNNKHKFKCLVDFDVFSDAVTQVVGLYDIDFIFMGTNGVTGAREVLLGSNTMNVIRHLIAPLIVVPDEYTYTPIDKILFSYTRDFEVNAAQVAPLKKLCELTQSSINFIAIHSKGDDHTNKSMNSMIANHFTTVEHTTNEVSGFKPIDAILVYQQFLNVQMHAMFYHNESFIERWFAHSQTSKISHSSLVPLLVLPV